MKKLILVVIVIVIGFFLFQSSSLKVSEEIDTEYQPAEEGLSRFGLQTDTSKKSINLEQVLSGGPGKDGIPAIDKPKFVSIGEAEVGGDVLGVFIEIDSEKRFYPYNILVWHEIVNDSIGDKYFAVTFCPLCGSAITFNREVEGKILSFGVSGLLFESNLLMYDRGTESLWSQAKNEAVVGQYTGTKLELINMRLIPFSALEKEHPEALVLSRETGHFRNYDIEPYSGYGLTEDLIFPVSVKDNRFPAKQIMYVVPTEKMSIVFEDARLKNSASTKIDGDNFTATREKDGIVVKRNGKTTPGYYEMWFSWATHHQEDGFVWKM